MSSSNREQIAEVFGELHTVVDRLLGLSFDALTTPERLALLARLKQEVRRLPVPGHELINQLGRQAAPIEIGGKLAHALADRLCITRADAKRRIDEAVDLGPRRGLTGEPLPALLEGTAAGQRAGELGRDHVAVIRRFARQLPGFVDAPTRAKAEADLAKRATEFRPEQVARLAEKLSDCLNPDGNFTDADRARRRGLAMGKQGSDGMSLLTGWLTPDARATLEAVWAKLAAPGMANPADDSPTVDGTPSQQAIDSDARSAAQRQHDGLTAGLRSLWPQDNLGSTTGCPRRSSCPPPCRSWKPLPAKRTPAAAPGYP
jgi:hypothetical protein